MNADHFLAEALRAQAALERFMESSPDPDNPADQDTALAMLGDIRDTLFEAIRAAAPSVSVETMNVMRYALAQTVETTRQIVERKIRAATAEAARATKH
ncbi:hypothetical protein [Paraburkholderia tropica]|uniref:hypothetical protein n=1 Tax=Paraburkholderia tropica TaxID=92647 RepID=UPI002AB66B6A|nr:hypothetical protein [Paraburkholderia tropica]